MSKKGSLLLLPNLLGNFPHHETFLPKSVDKAVALCDGLFAESEAEGRRYLSRFETKAPAREIPIAVFDHKTKDTDIPFLMEPLVEGKTWGLVVDAGLPCISDPGHKLVQRARDLGITVKAFVGPSSLLLALMLSGLPGSRFSFHGYLPKEQRERAEVIKRLQIQSRSENMTQLFIETPYRNSALLHTLLETLADEVTLSVAWDLTLPTQGIVTQKVAIWKKTDLPNLEKKPAVFLFAS